MEDKEGTVFIDRDGHLFAGHVLEWLRTGHIRLCKVEEQEALCIEADYFLLDELGHKLKNMIYREKISNNDFWKFCQHSTRDHLVLTYADLRYVVGFRCLLTKTNIVEYYSKFVFTGCDLRGIDFSNIALATNPLQYTRAAFMDFDHTILTKVTFEKSVIKASFKCATLIDCNFQEVKFINSPQGSPCFDKADLTNANFSDGHITRGSFTDCILKAMVLTWRTVPSPVLT